MCESKPTMYLQKMTYVPYGELLWTARGWWRNGPALKVRLYGPTPPPPWRVRERGIDLMTYR